MSEWEALLLRQLCCACEVSISPLPAKGESLTSAGGCLASCTVMGQLRINIYIDSFQTPVVSFL